MPGARDDDTSATTVAAFQPPASGTDSLTVARDFERRRIFDAGEVIGERYVVEALLGRGGFAEVYRVADRQRDGRTLALKAYRLSSTNRLALEALKGEFALLGSLTHPHLATVYDFGYSGAELAFFTQSLVRGVRLDQLGLALDGTPRAVHLLAQLCRALDYLHARGILHGDIKPSNVIVDPERDHLTLLDFGIARAFGPALDGTIVGTFQYLAPETILGGPIDARADLYAVGVTLYRLVAGRAPFRGSPEDVMMAQLSRPPPPLDAARASAPLRAVISRLLEKEAADRYASAPELLAALGEATGAVMEADDTLASYVLSARFVGREREAAALVERVSAPSGPLVVIGEAGTGKSRLLREVRQRLQLAAIPWIAIDLQRADDEQALLVALAAGVLGPEVVAALDDEERLELARVLPELQRKNERILTAIDPERSRAARLAAMGRAIALRFGRNAGVLAIDDLHFAGAETAAALTAILSAARAHGATCLFVVTARPCEQARDLERDLGASRVDLITLSPELALRLCESMFGDAALLADTSLGRAIAEEPRSALWVQESLRLAIDAGAIVRAAGRWRVLADVAARPLGEVLAARLAEIPAAARELALASAVLAHPATPADLAAVSGRPLGDAAIALGDLRRAGIVEDRSDAQGHVTYAMHDRYVEAALATSEARPRAAMHRNVARWLARRGRWWDLAAAAQHWLDAGDAARAARTFRLAAARCDRSGRPDRALELCTAELALLERAAERAPAWLTLHDLACKAGRPERAEASLLELERIAPRLDPAKRVEITLRRARSTFRTGDAAAAQRLCRRALGRSRALDRGDLECELLLLSAEIESTFGRARVALQRYREAAELAGERDDAARGATAWLGVALAEIHAGRYPEALAASSRAIRAARALGDRGLLSEALRHHGSAQRDGGNSTAAARSYRRAIEAARQCGGQELEAKALNNLGTVAQSLGRPAQAIEAYGRSIALKLRAGAATSALVTQNNLGSLLAATGRLDEARVAFENALALAGGATPQIVHLMQCNLGDVHLAEGHLDEALALFRAAFVAYEARAQDDYGLYAVTGLVRALAMRAAPGDLEEASAFEPRFEALSRTFPMPERLRRLHVTAALLADARGDLELAHRAARRAAEQTDARADFSGVFGTFVEARWLAALLHARAGSAAKAARTAAAARRSLERIARRLGDDATRTAFLGGHPVHCAILGGELDTPAGWLWKPCSTSMLISPSAIRTQRC